MRAAGSLLALLIATAPPPPGDDASAVLAPCASRRTSALFDRRERRIERALEQAGAALAADALVRAANRLVLAERGIRFLRRRLDTLARRGAVSPGCAAIVDTGLDALAARAAALRATGTPPSSTTTTTTTTTSTTSSTTSTVPEVHCGNGRLDRFEQCDGTNVFGRTCQTLGWMRGELRCGPDCIFDTRGCSF
jgi:hypothetical protein